MSFKIVIELVCVRKEEFQYSIRLDNPPGHMLAINLVLHVNDLKRPLDALRAASLFRPNCCASSFVFRDFSLFSLQVDKELGWVMRSFYKVTKGAAFAEYAVLASVLGVVAIFSSHTIGRSVDATIRSADANISISLASSTESPSLTPSPSPPAPPPPQPLCVGVDRNGLDLAHGGSDGRALVGFFSVDTVTVTPGSYCDLRLLSGSNDVIMFPGTWADYNRDLSISGAMRFTRQFGNYLEEIIVSNDSVFAGNDLLRFSDLTRTASHARLVGF